MHYVIIGNSAAAVGCIEAIRQHDTQGAVTVVSKEPHHTYSRPLISYLLCGKTDEAHMKYRADDFYDANHCTFLPGREALTVDAAAQTVALDDGSVLSYDRLLLATGSVPLVPPIEGLDTVPQAFTFLTLDDAHALQAAISPTARVFIVGAGLIGLKCAEGLAGHVGEITVVDLAAHILPSVLDETAAVLVQQRLEAHSVSCRLGDSVQALEPARAHLKSGGTVDFDVLVMAVGMRPNVALAQTAGCTIGRGIVTDDVGQTSVPHIYAAGDCTECLDITTGQRRVLALLPNAYCQGECAGRHMTGHAVPFDRAIPLNAVGFFGLPVATAGSYDGDAWVASNAAPGTYKKLVVRDNRLVGFILVGNMARAGIYTALIRNQTPLDTLDFDLIRKRPQLMAFARTHRNAMLAHVPAGDEIHSAGPVPVGKEPSL